MRQIMCIAQVPDELKKAVYGISIDVLVDSETVYTFYSRDAVMPVAKSLLYCVIVYKTKCQKKSETNHSPISQTRLWSIRGAIFGHCSTMKHAVIVY